ncbi:hypothetical protein Tco_1129101 [Tanacetum coccineum]
MVDPNALRLLILVLLDDVKGDGFTMANSSSTVLFFLGSLMVTLSVEILEAVLVHDFQRASSVYIDPSDPEAFDRAF